MKTHIINSPINSKERQELDLRVGDTIIVTQKIIEGEKVRLQKFQGLVIAIKHGKEPGATFTVRRIANGYGVEKIYPLYSPLIDQIEVVRRANVRRSKLYYIRDKTAKTMRHKLRRLFDVAIGTESATEKKRRETLEHKRLEEEEAKRQAEIKRQEEEATKKREEEATKKAQEQETAQQAEVKVEAKVEDKVENKVEDSEEEKAENTVEAKVEEDTKKEAQAPTSHEAEK